MASIEGYQMFQRSNAEARAAGPVLEATNVSHRDVSNFHNGGDGSGDGHMESTQHESEELTQQSNTNNSATKMARTGSKDIWGMLRRLGGDHEEIELFHRVKDLKRDTYTLGRSSKCDITVADTWVSTNHCSIYCDYTQAKLRIFIEDSSANGTFINDSLTRLRKGERMELKSGDQIFLLNPRKVETEDKKFATFTYINLRERLVAVREISFAPNRMPTVSQQLQQMQRSPPQPLRPLPGSAAPARDSQASLHSSLSSQNSQRCALHIEDKYIIGDQIGSGMSGQVYLCVNKLTHEHFAVKMIDTRKFTLTPGLSVSDLREEAVLMRQFDHPSIIKVVDTFQSESMIYIVMELLRGGDLFDRIIEKERYGEESARQLMIQVLSAVEYLHERQIIHRDLKPENILLVSTKSDVQVKVTDFGLAKKANSAGLKTFCGTPQYFAPEVLKRKNNVQSGGRYGAAVDMWSLGVVLYILLSGSFPFSDDEEILRADYSLAGMEWEGISPGAKHLIRSLMTLQVDQRYTVQQALKHPWICGIAYVPAKIQQVLALQGGVAAAPQGGPGGSGSGAAGGNVKMICDNDTSADNAAQAVDAGSNMKDTSAPSSATAAAPASVGKKRQASTAAGANTLTRKQSSVSTKKANLRRGGSVFAPLELKYKSSMEYVSSSSNLVMLHTSLPAAIADVISADSVFNSSSAAAMISTTSAPTSVTVSTVAVVTQEPVSAVKAEPVGAPKTPSAASAGPPPSQQPVRCITESPEHYIDLTSNVYSSTVTEPTAHASIVHLTVTNQVSFMDNLRQPSRTKPVPAPPQPSATVITTTTAMTTASVSIPGPSAFKRSLSFDDSTSYNTHLNKFPEFPEALLIPSRPGAGPNKTQDMNAKVSGINNLDESIDPYDDVIEDYSSDDGNENNQNASTSKRSTTRKGQPKKASQAVIKAAKATKPPLPASAARGCMKKTKPVVAADAQTLQGDANSSTQTGNQGLQGTQPPTHVGAVPRNSTGMPPPPPLQRKRSVSFCERLVVVDIGAPDCDAPLLYSAEESRLSSVTPEPVTALVTPVEAANALDPVVSQVKGKVFNFDTVEGLNIAHITLSNGFIPAGDGPRVVTPSNLASATSSTSSSATTSIDAKSDSAAPAAKATIGIKRTQSSLEQAWKIKAPASDPSAMCTPASSGSSAAKGARSNENVINASASAEDGEPVVQVGKKLRTPMKSLSELFRANSTTKH